MEVQKKHFDEIFEFKGKWDVPSKCGLRILTVTAESGTVTELTMTTRVRRLPMPERPC